MCDITDQNLLPREGQLNALKRKYMMKLLFEFALRLLPPIQAKGFPYLSLVSLTG